MAATRDRWSVVAKCVLFEHHDDDSDAEGGFVGRVAGVVGPARGTNSAEAMHEARKNRHVLEQRDRIFNATIAFVDTDARAGVSAIGARSLAGDCRSDIRGIYIFSLSCLSETLYIEKPLQRLSSAASEMPQNGRATPARRHQGPGRAASKRRCRRRSRAACPPCRTAPTSAGCTPPAARRRRPAAAGHGGAESGWWPARRRRRPPVTA